MPHHYGYGRIHRWPGIDIVFGIQPGRMTQTEISLAKNLNLRLKGHVSVETRMNKQVVSVLNTPRQVRQQSPMLVRKSLSERINITMRHPIGLESRVGIIVVGPALFEIHVVGFFEESQSPSQVPDTVVALFFYK